MSKSNTKGFLAKHIHTTRYGSSSDQSDLGFKRSSTLQWPHPTVVGAERGRQLPSSDSRVDTRTRLELRSSPAVEMNSAHCQAHSDRPTSSLSPMSAPRSSVRTAPNSCPRAVNGTLAMRSSPSEAESAGAGSQCCCEAVKCGSKPDGAL